MIDRIINLISLLCFSIICSICSFVVYDSWESTKPWEKVWVLKSEKKANIFDQFDIPQLVENRSDPEKVLSALSKAEMAFDLEAAKVIRKHLESNFMQTGDIKVRFSGQELLNILQALFWSSLTLIIPLSINYVRHGQFRIWNKGSSQVLLKAKGIS